MFNTPRMHHGWTQVSRVMAQLRIITTIIVIIVIIIIILVKTIVNRNYW